MKTRTMLSACLLAGVALTALTALPAVALAQPAAASAYKAPRAGDGRADISGVWSNATVSRLERAANYGDRLVMTPEELAKIEGDTAARNARLNAPTDQTKGVDDLDECQSGAQGAACGYNAGWTDPGSTVMRVGGQPRTSFITSPANGRVPPSVRGGAAAARAGGATRQNDNPEGRSLGERCIMSFGSSSGPIMQSQLYNNTYRFLQTADYVAIWVEMVHDMRIVRLNSTHRTDGVRTYMGDSIGRWDGDTLVVETINYHPSQSVRGSGPKLKVTEKFTRAAKDRLLYQFVVEDPDTWAQPWKGEYEFASIPGDVYEYACHEGNYGLQNILAGARAEDASGVVAAGGPQARGEGGEEDDQ